uniref:Estradiol 17-beta-dehydrogenase n=1 Tax=Rhabditophanes sp. KR3021 TaxID=114890 RepID=A0AC35UFM7_9BILA
MHKSTQSALILLYLYARSDQKLQSVKQEIEEQIRGIDVETIVFDFTNADIKDYENKIFNKLKTLDVGVVVNNVGIISNFPEVLHKSDGDFEKSRNILTVNTLATTILTQEVLTQMVPRKRGIIVNIGSIAGLASVAEYSVYSSTKKYISHFSAILAKEYKPHGITIQYVSPGLVTTNMSKVTEASFFGPNPEDFVESALKTVGTINETCGYIGHQIEVEIFNLLPPFVLDLLLKKKNESRRTSYFKSIEATQ